MTTPATVAVDHDDFQDLLDRAKELEDSGGDYGTEGLDGQIDPDVLSALRSEEAEDASKREEAHATLSAGRVMDQELSEADAAGAHAINSVETTGFQEGAPSSAMSQAANESNTSYTPPSAAAGPIMPGTMVGGASPTGSYNAAQALAQMQQPGLVDYSNYNPTPQTSTQYDTYNAPNREALIRAIMDYAESDYSDTERGDNGMYTAGGGTVTPAGEGATATERAGKILAQEYVELRQDYTWGGGHGAEPGPSQGISDGGGAADANGDYNKIGMDCSGLSRDFTYNWAGIDIGPGSTHDQIASGMPVAESDLQFGDLVFPHDGHVQIYIGDGQVLEAQQSGTQYMVSEYQPGPTYIRRFVDVAAA